MDVIVADYCRSGVAPVRGARRFRSDRQHLV